ncbi:MAG: TolC family protein [Lunatimonas sp.]|uniref:TolC family protein n=1 Tax=Lunatimonas sp. TaxID=2060141 RepID=UPI00263B4C6B|nr:TolC family protein [Lunatimonas sp.]MCC5938679.1 TolC family protein [Lunatimonas sp.]
MKTFLYALLIFWTLPVQSQQFLETYIRHGLESNEVLKQQQFSLEKSMYALKEATGLFLPRVSFEANYFLAGGGRTVDFPAGDILNPVYSTLNQLTESSNFPIIENQRILLNPNNFYDVRVRTAMPVFNAELEGKGKKVVGFNNWVISNLPRVTPDSIMMKIKKNLASPKS